MFACAAVTCAVSRDVLYGKKRKRKGRKSRGKGGFIGLGALRFDARIDGLLRLIAHFVMRDLLPSRVETHSVMLAKKICESVLSAIDDEV